MRGAPPVDVGLGSGRREQSALAILWAVGGGVAAAWLSALAEWPPAWPSALGAVLLAACGWHAGPPMRGGRLRWDGARWCWHRPGTATPLDLPGWRPALDFGGWLLLRDDAGHWCGLSAGDAQSLWHGVRVALHSTPGADAPQRSS